MATLLGLLGYTKSSSGAERLISAYGNDYHLYNPNLDIWEGQGVPNSSSEKVYGDVFLDLAFFVNGSNDNRRYDATTWTNETYAKRAPIAKYIKNFSNRLYLGYVTYNGNTFTSRVWYTDLPKNNDITYGLEYGTNLVQNSNNATVFSALAKFKSRGIKVGDPFIILTGTNAGEYNVASVDSETQLTLTEPMKNSATGSSYWIGGNWFDVVTDDNDILTGLGENSAQLLCFKKESLHRYNGTNLQKVKGVPGTTSQNSVVNIKDHTYYFHRTGIWRYDGVTSELISRPIQDYIDGMSTDMINEVVAWRTGQSKETYRIYIGDVDNNDVGLEINRCFLDFDTITETWSPGSLPYSIEVTTEFSEQNNKNTYIGGLSGISPTIFQDNKGNSDNEDPIPWMFDTGWHFPAGPQVEIEITRIQIHSQRGYNLPVKYRLYGTPWKVDKYWKSLGDIKNRVTEFELRSAKEKPNFARGINLRVDDSSTTEPPLVERIDIFYKLATVRSF